MMNGFDYKIIRMVFEGGGAAHLYTIHTKLKLSLGEILRAINPIITSGIVTLDDLTLKLTAHGRDWVQENARSLRGGEKIWLEVPVEFRQPALPPNKPYLPKANRVDKTLLPASWQKR